MLNASARSCRVAMTPHPAEAQAVSEIYEFLRLAAARRQPVTAIYDGLLRLLCPHAASPLPCRLLRAESLLCLARLNARPPSSLSSCRALPRCAIARGISSIEVRPGT